MPFPWDLADVAVENLASGMLIITYLAYEFRYGRGRKWANQLEGLVAVVIALAEENPNINEEAVVHRFNGDRPEEFKGDVMKTETEKARYEYETRGDD